MNIAITFATLSGNTAEFAREIAYYLSTKSLSAQVFDLLEVQIEQLLKFDLILFGGSTYGDGGFNPITEIFFENYADSQDYFRGTKIAVFALGDSSYPNFGQSGYLMQQSLTKLGAHVLEPLVIIDGPISDENRQLIRGWVDEVLKRQE